jgi:hypothetical protein
MTVIAESYVARCSSVTSPGKAGCGQLAVLHASGVSNKLHSAVAVVWQ